MHLTQGGKKMKISMNKKEKSLLYALDNERTLKEGFEEFIRDCKARNLSKDTVDYYKNCYKILLKVEDIEEESEEEKEKEPIFTEDTQLSLIQSQDLSKINRFLLENYKATSANSYLRGIRAIFYFFMDLHYMEKMQIGLVKATKQVKPTYTDEELDKLLKKPNIKAKNASFSEYRNWVIVNYMLATGNRLSTICNLKNKDVNLDSDVIVLEKTKNRKEQIIPISRTLHIILKEYMSYREGTEEDYLFCNQSGFKFTEDACKHAIAKYNRKRGVRKTSCHVFRHTFAKKWIMNGGDIFRLQKLLGHSSMEMVKEYVAIYGEDLHKNYNDFNPLESLKPRVEKIPTMKGRKIKA